MTLEEKKKGFLSKIFSGNKSCCCNIKIEEVAEDNIKKDDDKSGDEEISPCCGTPPSKGNP